MHRGRVRVVGDDLDCLVPLAGRLSEPPVVGDWVSFDGERVSAVLPRRSHIARGEAVLAANIDTGLVLAPSHEEPDLSQIERYTALVAESGIEPVVVLTKQDLSPDSAIRSERIREEIGAEVFVISSQEGWGVRELQARLSPRSTTVLIGMSGVGKSTLLNHLLGEERQRTLPVRKRDGAGRHATVHRELFPLPSGALLIDIPGFRSATLTGPAGVPDAFADVIELAKRCKFSDCRHESEPGCAVRGAIPSRRLSSMRGLEGEGADAVTRRARRRS